MSETEKSVISVCNDAIDTARAWVRLYELKTGSKYRPGRHFSQSGRGIKEPFLEIAEEVGVSKDTIWEHLKLLNEPKYVIEDLLAGRPRTYYREAEILKPQAIGQ